MSIEVKTQPFNTFVPNNRKCCSECKYCSKPRLHRGMAKSAGVFNMYCKHPIFKLNEVKTSCIEARFFEDACGKEGKLYEPK